MRDTDEADKAKASEMEIRVKEMEMERKVKHEKKIQMDIISDMVRQYKSVEEQLMDKMNSLSQKKMDNEQETKRLVENQAALDAEILEIESSKDEQIGNLKKNIEEMSSDFATMLKDTLEKMKGKIEDANTKWENENDNTMLERFKEVSNLNN